MDTNLGTSSNSHVNDIVDENIDNTNIDINNEYTNIFLCIKHNFLDNVPYTISMR